MSKNFKRYLMLLAVTGLVAVGMGGSGTFATFNAEVANNANTFASGTLYLHDTNGSTTCGSESSTTNSNLGTVRTADNGCATLLSTTLPTASTTLSGATITSGTSVSSLTVSALHGSAIETGDEIIVNNGTNSQPFYATAAVSPGATSIPVSTQNAAYTFTAGNTVTDDARFVPLQLKNAGTLDASSIKVALGTGGCLDGAATTTTNTLSGTYIATNTSLTLGTALVNGIPAGTVISIAAPSAETVTTTAAANPGTSTLAVTALANGHANGTAISWAVSFTGGSALCTTLPIVVVETGSTYGHDTGTPALGCAYGSSVANYGCTFGANTISSISTTPALTALTLASGANTNTLTQLDASKSRYFVIGVQSPGSLPNGSQNKRATFDLIWHIDQA